MSERLFRFGQAYQACNVDWSSCELRSLGLTRLDEYACGFSYVVPGFSSKDQKKWRSTEAPASCKKLETTEIQSYGSFYFSNFFHIKIYNKLHVRMVMPLFVAKTLRRMQRDPTPGNRPLQPRNRDWMMPTCCNPKKHMKCTICIFIC